MYQDDFSKRFKALYSDLKRTRTVMTQKEMAGLIGVTEGTIRNYLSRNREPGAEILSKICRVFNLNPAWLLWGEGNMFRGHEDGKILEEEEQRLLSAFRSASHLREKLEIIEYASSLKEEKLQLVQLEGNLNQKSRSMQMRMAISTFLPFIIEVLETQLFRERLQYRTAVKFIEAKKESKEELKFSLEDLTTTEMWDAAVVATKDGIDRSGVDYILSKTQERLVEVEERIERIINIDFHEMSKALASIPGEQGQLQTALKQYFKLSKKEA